VDPKIPEGIQEQARQYKTNRDSPMNGQESVRSNMEPERLAVSQTPNDGVAATSTGNAARQSQANVASDQATDESPTVHPQPTSTPTTVALRETVEIIGESVKGKPLTAYVLGNGPNVTVIFGGFHGNEPTPPRVVDHLRAYLKNHPQELQGCRVILVPRTNPDGLATGSRTNANRVDLNRNYPGTWQKKARADRYHPGAQPASEPETQAVIKLLDRYHPQKVISIHQPLRTMNWTGEKGRRLAAEMKKYNDYPTTGDIGYPTPGSFGDYCGKVLGIGIVTLELPNIGTGAAWQQNKDALLAAIHLQL